MPLPLKFVDKTNSGFFTTVKERVNDYFQSNGLTKQANGAMVLKTIIYLVSFVLLYLAILLEVFPSWVSLLLAIALGMNMAFIGFNICHDALHGSYSSKPWVNNTLGFIFNIIGANVYIWKITHNKIHHTYTNIVGHDGDLEIAPGVVRVSEKEKHHPIHRYQHIYAFFLYSLASVSWFFKKDYKKFFQKKIGQHESNHPRIEYVKLFSYKLMYYSLFIILPLLVMSITWWQFLIGFLALNLAMGLVIGLVFQLAHLVEQTSLPDPEKNKNIEEAWAEHQLKTTANFARDSRLTTFLCGGLNLQVEHHLFPKICHIHYPQISGIVKKTSLEFGLPYHENTSFASALKSHYNFLKKAGKKQLA